MGKRLAQWPVAADTARTERLAQSIEIGGRRFAPLQCRRFSQHFSDQAPDLLSSNAPLYEH
jgi:hypothetical protein